MDIKSAFLNKILKEEVSMKHSPSCKNVDFLHHVFKLDKSLYDLKQSFTAWYEKHSKLFMENGFNSGKIDNTLFLKVRTRNLLIIQVYMNDIIFGATTSSLCDELQS